MLAGNISLGGLSPRQEAKWQSIVGELAELGAIAEGGKGVFTVTESGFDIADQYRPLEADATTPSPFEDERLRHIRTLLESLRCDQRDFLRAILLKGGSVRSDVISQAWMNLTGGIDFNGLCSAPQSGGLVTRKDNHMDGHPTFTIPNPMVKSLQELLFPRAEGNNNPHFKGL